MLTVPPTAPLTCVIVSVCVPSLPGPRKSLARSPANGMVRGPESSATLESGSFESNRRIVHLGDRRSQRDQVGIVRERAVAADAGANVLHIAAGRESAGPVPQPDRQRSGRSR